MPLPCPSLPTTLPRPLPTLRTCLFSVPLGRPSHSSPWEEASQGLLPAPLEGQGWASAAPPPPAAAIGLREMGGMGVVVMKISTQPARGQQEPSRPALSPSAPVLQVKTLNAAAAPQLGFSPAACSPTCSLPLLFQCSWNISCALCPTSSSPQLVPSTPFLFLPSR